jgi:hypothetical protein
MNIEIKIIIGPNNKENYINVNLENQQLILESSIIEKRNIICNGQYEIKEIQVTIDDCKYITQFNVTTMYKKEFDIILYSIWLETLCTFILNM